MRVKVYVRTVNLLTFLAASATAREQEISGAPPPYTILLSFTRFLITHRASCILLLPSSTICCKQLKTLRNRICKISDYLNGLSWKCSLTALFLNKLLPKLSKTYHFVTAPDEDGHCPWVIAVFNDQHFFFGGTKWQFPHSACCSKLLFGEFFKPWHNSASSCNCN